MKVAREGIPIILGFAAGAMAVSFGALWLFGAWGWPIATAAVALLAWCVWFFRDPERVAPADPSAVICPADGVVCLVDRAEAPPELGMTGSGTFERVCVFMNVFNVHVNRVPCGGVIEKVAYTPGKFFNASLDKASVDNERTAVAMKTADGRSVIFVQIAGLVARRIICRLKGGERVSAGERFGLIRFGSRVDVYMPPGTAVGVKPGQKVVAGESVLARLAGSSSVARERIAEEVPVGR